jgi:hypothetical protein
MSVNKIDIKLQNSYLLLVEILKIVQIIRLFIEINIL